MSTKVVFITSQDEDAHTIWCYGNITPNCNFSIICDDTQENGVITDIDTETHDNWHDVVDYIENCTHFENIDEIEVIKP